MCVGVGVRVIVTGWMGGWVGWLLREGKGWFVGGMEGMDGYGFSLGYSIDRVVRPHENVVFGSVEMIRRVDKVSGPCFRWFLW